MRETSPPTPTPIRPCLPRMCVSGSPSCASHLCRCFGNPLAESQSKSQSTECGTNSNNYQLFIVVACWWSSSLSPSLRLHVPMSLPGLGNPSIARYRDQEELCEILCNLLENFPLHSCTFSFTVLGLFISLMTINDATRLWKSKWKCSENEGWQRWLTVGKSFENLCEISI